MKKSKFLFGLFIPVLSGCSCSLFNAGTFSWENYKNNSFAMSLSSEKFKNFKLEDFDLDSKKEKLQGIVTSKGSRDEFVRTYNEISSNLTKIINCYIISSTKYYASNDSSYQSKANNYYSTYLGTNKFLMSLEEDIYNSSKAIKEAYFGGLSDEEIENRLNGNKESKLEADYDEIFSQYQDDGQQLYSKYRNGKINEQTYLDQGYSYLIRYANKAKELTDQISYDNYLDFSYDYYYSRDYKSNDATSFINYVKQYFVPILKNKTKLTKPNNVDSDLLKIVSSYNLCNKNANMCDLFESYAEEMDGQYLTAYNNAFKYGYYCFSDNNNSMGTAYEWNLNGMNDAVLFFSSNYQDVLSVVHEFGHYYSCVQNSGVRKNDAYDLQETYSQGNEFTFCKYLLDKKKDDGDFATYNYFVDAKIYDSIQQIINEAAITEIEQYLYTANSLDKTTLIDKVNDILASYDGTASRTYFMAACLASPCYYVSYATSLMEALQFAALSFEDAKTTYKKLIETSGKFTMVERWEQAGLTSPFDEQTFITLGNMFQEIENKY